MARKPMHPQLQEELVAAQEAWYRTQGRGEIRDYLKERHLLATSDCANVAVITWGILDRTGYPPTYIAPSRGHSYRVRYGLAAETLVRVPDSTDHRTIEMVEP